MALTPAEVAAFQQQAQQCNDKLKSSSGQTPAKIPDGAHRYRILPHWETKSPATFGAFHRYARHFVKGMPQGQKANLAAVTLCNKNTYGQPCPVCETYWEAKNAVGLPKEAEKAIQDANAGTRYLVNALHLTGAEPGKVIVLDLPFKIGTAIFGDPKTGSTGLIMQWLNLKGAYMFDLVEGSDVIIRKSGTGLGTSYSIELPGTPSAAVPASILDNLTNLDEYIANWKHTPEEEAKAISTIQSLVTGGTPNAAMAMADVFAQPLPRVDIPFETPKKLDNDPVTGASVTEDVFDVAPTVRSTASNESVEDIESLLGELA